MVFDVVFYFLKGPAGDRIELDQVMGIVPFNRFQVTSGDTLVSALASDPYVVAQQCPI